ncbi:DUF748 domain-containing protein [Flavicella marina]|uniref:DUF748 domain-containing protein n=1 Tax=Flavicella marina TaxID=1475951 RepID=UPI0012641A44|nr:DUF748 domain-containing protein [Flavicella marina]
MKKKKLKIVLGVVVVFITLILWLLPVVSKSLLEKNGKEWIGRKVSVEDIDINLFTGTVKAFNFDLYESDDSTSFVSFDTLVLNTRPFHYFTSKITLQQFYVKNLETKVIKENDSSFNFDSLIAFYNTPVDSSEVEEVEIDTTEVLKFSLSNIEFVNAQISFNDKVIEEEFVFDELDLLIPNIEWNQKDASNADLEFNFRDGGRFYSSTNFDPIKGDFNANIGLVDLDLSAYTKYLQDFLLLDSANGLLTTNLNFNGNSNYLDTLAIDGFVKLNEFQMNDTLKKPILKAEEISCVFGKLEPLKNSYLIDSVQLTKPYVRFDMYQTTTNFDAFFRLNEPVDSVAVAEVELDSSEGVANDSVPELYYKLNSFRIVDGKLQFNDITTSQPFQYNLTSIEVDLDSMDSKTEWVDMQAQMLLNKRGVMKVDVSFNPLDPMELELKYVISGFKLNDLNIYSMDYMGVPVLEGDMYYKTNTKIHNGELDSQNKLIVHNATLGDKRGGLYNLPLKFALFLLKDKDGVVNLDVPVDGDLNDPNVSINKIVWYSFKNLLVKTVASPVKFLGGLVGGDPKDLETFEFSYLDTALSDAHLKQLDKLQELEKKKEGLLIDMLYLNDIEIEKRHIAVQQIGNDFNKKYKKKNYLDDEKEFKLYLLEKTQKDASDATIEKMLDSSFVEGACVSLTSPVLIDSLAHVYETKRIEGIRKQLLESETKNHIKVRKAKPDDPENIASKPIFKIVYSIEE